jgi:ParB/RepB/Spo0J family partition protein
MTIATDPTAEYAARHTPIDPPLELSGLTLLDRRLLQPSPLNPRRAFPEAELAELAQSLREVGMLEPLIVRVAPPRAEGGTPAEPVAHRETPHATYEIVAGERRWRAAELAELASVPVRIASLTDRQHLTLALIENVQRQDLTPLEEAEGYRQLHDLGGLTQSQIAQRVGKAQPDIAKRLALLRLPEAVQAMIRAGTLSPSHGVIIARYMPSYPEVALHVAKITTQKGLSVKQLEHEPLPVPYALESRGLVRDLSSYSAKFDYQHVCANCPFQAHHGTHCIHPPHYDELQAAAIVDLRARVLAAVAEKRAIPLADVQGIPYRWADQGSAREGCTEACPCRLAVTINSQGTTRGVCIDPERFLALRPVPMYSETTYQRADEHLVGSMGPTPPEDFPPDDDDDQPQADDDDANLVALRAQLLERARELRSGAAVGPTVVAAACAVALDSLLGENWDSGQRVYQAAGLLGLTDLATMNGYVAVHDLRQLDPPTQLALTTLAIGLAEVSRGESDYLPFILGVGVCRACGCTDQSACYGGCTWVEPDLCSACAGPADDPEAPQ